eukprot:264292-Chlamydomonas_euryale.AAC.1
MRQWAQQAARMLLPHSMRDMADLLLGDGWRQGLADELPPYPAAQPGLHYPHHQPHLHRRHHALAPRLRHALTDDAELSDDEGVHGGGPLSHRPRMFSKHVGALDVAAAELPPPPTAAASVPASD